MDGSSSFLLSAAGLLAIVVSIPSSRELQFSQQLLLEILQWRHFRSVAGRRIVSPQIALFLTATHAVDKYPRTERRLQCDPQMVTKSSNGNEIMR